MNKKRDIEVYRKLVSYVRTGFLALDESYQNEIKTFINNQQHFTGGFTDRAGEPDLYYSLFGLWLSLATRQKELQNKLKHFVSNKDMSESKNPVEDMALFLIKSILNSNQKKQSVLSIVRTAFRKGKMIELSYQFFLISLTIDAVGKNKKLYYFFARIWLYFYKSKGTIPCSLTAALAYARKMLGLNTKNIRKKLVSFSIENSGFRAFESVKTPDTLSTGVALFVLKETDYDLRMIKPGCLNFVQENYDSGAFLSGDGDQTKDLEYTFYGLLALGSLLTDEF
jgi:hypothetical protein